ncbi:hypothetical protein GCM10022255_104140 [Dactylosporangium darangshiense]|uniref:SnoaL-like domain-containing protein n=1 Tax=Dactylosporangium darangshiense TaxID=579108 RepID=A0ABP8DSR1_9ACTN
MNTLIQHWLDLRNGDYAAAEACVSPDIRVHAALLDGGDSSAVGGPAGVVAWIAQTRAAFSELTFAIEVGPIVDGDMVALRWRASGAYAGGFPGAAAKPGTANEFTGTDTLRVAGGLIADYWINPDIHVLLAQLRVLA